jgi:glycosyltransferase involved in cell wall biosynthesis
MRIAIDFTAFLPQMTGVDTYLTQLVRHLARVDRHNEYRIFHNTEDRSFFQGDWPANFSRVALCARPRPIRLAFQQALLPIAASAWNADVVHSPSFIMPYVRGRARHALTVQDMTSFSHPQCHNALRRSLPYRFMVLSSLRRSDVVVVPSNATRDAVLHYLPGLPADRVRVTVLGVDRQFRPRDRATVTATLARTGLPEKYVLYVGTLEPRKGLETLIGAYRELLRTDGIEEHLVIVGKLGWGYDEVLRLAKDPSLSGRVRVAGYVEQSELPAVYSGARMLVYPSLHEGFGFPPLEAMACGTPVVSTRSSSLTENFASAADLVPPRDVSALSEAMRRLLTDRAHWDKRRAQGLSHSARYDWDQTARDTLMSYETAFSRNRR